MVQSGTFRQDLYHRLNVFPLSIPPLRERPDDIPLLANFFIGRFGQEIEPPVVAITDDAIKKLVQYSWPGNVRELQNVLRRAIVLARSSVITADDCQMEIAVSGENQGMLSIDSLIDETLQTGESAAFQQVISKVECALITKALLLSKGNQVQAAKLLGINRLTLRKKIEAYSCQAA